MHLVFRRAAAGLALAATLLAAQAQSSPVTLLHSFSMAEGFTSAGNLLLAPDGALYGTLEWGGDGVFGTDNNGDGTLFRVGADGGVAVVHQFNHADGGWPVGSMALAPDGLIWGSTQRGGDFNQGTIFTFEPATQVLTTRHHFTGTDGAYPTSLTRGADGLLYGVTQFGGAAGIGTVFRIDPATGALATLHEFTDRAKGAYPLGGVVLASDGAVWGSTTRGGIGGGHKGVLFRIGPFGHYRVVHAFHHLGQEGCDVHGDLMQASNGLIYGTASRCGAYPNQGMGTVFALSLAGEFQVVHQFELQVCGDPEASVTEAPDGTLYGTAARAGHGDKGCVWKITPDGGWELVRRFHPVDPAARPGTAAVLRDGKLYTTSTADVFSIAPF